MRWRSFIGPVLAIAAGSGPVAGAWAEGAIDCTCRFRGTDYHVGEVVCLNGPDGPRLAQCQFVLNNTSWQRLEMQCPIGALDVPDIDPPAKSAPAAEDGAAIPLSREG